jgi:metallophosphoesterase superfamily enzyme
MIIVMGNHDILPVSLLLECDLRVYANDYEEAGFVFTHHPKLEFDISKFVFAGHVHPVFTSYGKGRQSVRLPCFVVDKYQAILPSFGVFTGGYQMGLADDRKIYITTETRIFSVC